MNPWIIVSIASAAAAAAFFFAGYLLSPRRGRVRPQAAPSLAGSADVNALLALLVQHTDCEAAALLDAHGLLVAGSGFTDPEARAIAASVVAALLDVHHHGLADFPGVCELQTTRGRTFRVRVVSSGDRPYVVTTLGGEGPAAPDLEERIAGAIPQLVRAA